MANQNVPNAAADADSQTGGSKQPLDTPSLACTYWPPNDFDFENEGFRLQGFVALAEWIERARELTEKIEFSASHDPEFRALLKSHDLSYFDACWEEEESNGLRRLMSEIRSSAIAMQEAGMAAATALRNRQKPAISRVRHAALL